VQIRHFSDPACNCTLHNYDDWEWPDLRKGQMILKGLSHNITAQKEEGKVGRGRGQPENGFASSVCVHNAR
jgi:hypothetical protein